MSHDAHRDAGIQSFYKPHLRACRSHFFSDRWLEVRVFVKNTADWLNLCALTS
jgi:hypothetical protein